jgi:hypothetical protein
MRVLPLALAILLCAAFATAAPAQTLGPAASTGSAGDITVDAATVNGTVDPGGQPAHYRFQYGTSTGYGTQTADQPVPAGSSAQDVAAALSGLAGNTVYHYRVVAWWDATPNEKVVGADRTFRTLAQPGASTGTAVDMRPDGTRLTGKVDPNRVATQWYFEWGETTAYGQRTPTADAGHGPSPVPVSSVLNGLKANTVYHFRTVAVNSAGVTEAGDRAFRTFRGPTGITIAVPVRKVRYGRVTAIDGVVQGTGIDGLRVALETQPFPFRAPFAPIGDSVVIHKDGSFRLISPPLQISTRMRVVSRSTPAVVSGPVTAFTELLVNAGTQRLTRHRYRIAGRVTPNVRGAKVSIQRHKGTRWVSVRRTRTVSIGRGRVGYRAVIKQFRKAQHYRVIVRPKKADYALGTSRTFRVRGTRR